MPSRKENRRFVKIGSRIGEANLLIRQRLTGSEHERLITAALDTAAVQLLLFVSGEPLSMFQGGQLDMTCEVNRSGALAGLQLLGWKRLVGVRALSGLFFPLIQPSEYVELVGAPEPMFSIFVEMTDCWYEMLKTEDEEEKSRYLYRLSRAVWMGLERYVYLRESSDLGSVDMMDVQLRLTILQTQTHEYFLARANGSPMPPTSQSQDVAALWYFEHFSLFAKLNDNTPTP
jgi:hypothetical protein